MKFKILLFSLICFVPALSFAVNSRDAAIDVQVFSPKPDGSEQDGMAKVYELQGKALITPKGSPEERVLKVGDEIRVGDAVYTEKGASLSISFDSRKQNAVRIPAETKATFTSIEPTDIKLDDGSIFNVVNGLAAGSTWKITTPSAVAAVRGTVFLVRYEAANGQMFAATVDVPDDGKTSAIEIQSLDGGGTADIAEGREILMKEGETPSPEMVKDLNPEAVKEVQAFFAQVSAESKVIENSSSGGNEIKSEGDQKPEADSPIADEPPDTEPPQPVFPDPEPKDPGPGDGHGLPAGCTSLPCDKLPDCHALGNCISQQ